MRKPLVCLFVVLVCLLLPESAAEAQRGGEPKPSKNSAEGKKSSRPRASQESRRGRSDNAPEVGERAPNFRLKSLDGKSTTELADFAGKKPVVLFFGSYT